MTNFMLFVECDRDKPTVPEVFGIDSETFGTFFEKLVERWNKPIEDDKATDVFFDALNEMPENKKAGLIMSMAVAQMTNQMKTMSVMAMMRKMFGGH